MKDGNKAIRAHVTGRVQGVSFRAWLHGEAVRRGLAGWVRNEPDGSVLAEISGAPEAVDAMIALLWEGPRAARVANVAIEPVGESDMPPGFVIRR